MQLPARFESAVRESHEFSTFVYEVITRAKPWFELSGTPFFPDYTDHSLTHATRLLTTAESLISDEAWEHFSSGDAAALVVAAVLHDAAMHLTEASFVRIINSPGMHAPTIRGWSILWSEFLADARRYDQKRLVGLFGDAEPIHVPPPDPADYTKRDRLLIGEFIRKHHHKLAYEFAIVGVPTDGEAIQLIPPHHSRIGELAGLIARSHGSSLRDSFTDVGRTFNIRKWRQIHPTYLMVLLRIADYLDIGPARAPKSLLSLKGIRSPISRREWNINYALDDIRQVHEDPEAIEIISYPDNVQEFIHMKRWLVDFQAELDTSWAVLGEVYGRYEGLNQLGLHVRRVRSNLDDITSLGKETKFVPLEATFKSAGSELLRLLVQPLYGDRPSIGVRELLQNAVDAVNELEHFKGSQEVNRSEFSSHEAEVAIFLETTSSGEYWLTISDRGIGMTPETICEYFLNIGASFRNSEWWRKNFTRDSGSSQVTRSGRFGIGVLAAFILGDEISVSTRHVTLDRHRGVRFSAQIDSELIELSWMERRIGTTIRVKLTETAARMLIDSPESWDWYCYRKPSVHRFLLPQKQRLLPSHSIPMLEEVTPSHWRRTNHPEYEGILWSFQRAPALLCNGYIVEERRETPPFLLREAMRLGFPNVSVSDPDGNLPLNLQRTGLITDPPPYFQSVWEDVKKDAIASIIANGPENPIYKESAFDSYFRIQYDGLEQTPPSHSVFFSTPTGFSLLEDWHVSTLGIRTIVFISAWDEYMEIPNFEISKYHGLDQCACAGIRAPGNDRSKRMMAIDRMIGHLYRPLYGITFCGLRLGLFSSDPAWSDGVNIGHPTRHKVITEARWIKGSVTRIGECHKSELDMKALIDAMEAARHETFGHPTTTSGLIAEFHVAPFRERIENPSSPLGDLWKKHVGIAEIPFNRADRSNLKFATDDLSQFVHAHIKERIK